MIKNEAQKVVGVIPAHLNSVRFPNKILFPFHNLPMIEHVRRRALLCHDFSEVVVGTCDQEIFDIIRKFGGDVVMTSPDHTMASDRVAEVAHFLDCSHVVNVQGDEILTIPRFE